MLLISLSHSHKRATAVGVFISPSVARISPLPLPHVRTRDNPRQSAMMRDRNHCDRTSLVRRTNRLPDCGTRADRATTARTLDRRSDRAPCAIRSTVELLPVRRVNNGERAKVVDFATAMSFPPDCSLSIVGASLATYPWVSSGSGRPVAR